MSENDVGRFDSRLQKPERLLRFQHFVENENIKASEETVKSDLVLTVDRGG